MTFLDKLAAVQNAIRELHADESLTAQDRAQCMIADDLLRNLSPHRAERERALSELIAASEDHERRPNYREYMPSDAEWMEEEERMAERESGEPKA